MTILKVFFFYLSTHKIENCLRTVDFYCVHGTHRSELLMRTEQKIVCTYAVRIVIYIAGLWCFGGTGLEFGKTISKAPEATVERFCHSSFMRKKQQQIIAYVKTKAQISCAVNAQLISAFAFTTQIVQFLLYLYPKFQFSSSLLCLHRLVCVEPGRKPQRLVFS